MATKVDAQKLVRYLGGPTVLRQKLKRKGHDISLKGINMWVYRGSIPADWLMTLATELGVNLKKFTKTTTSDDPDAVDIDALI